MVVDVVAQFENTEAHRYDRHHASSNLNDTDVCGHIARKRLKCFQTEGHEKANPQRGREYDEEKRNKPFHEVLPPRFMEGYCQAPEKKDHEQGHSGDHHGRTLLIHTERVPIVPDAQE